LGLSVGAGAAQDSGLDSEDAEAQDTRQRWARSFTRR